VNLLLDTNVLSEVQRPVPDLKVLGWFDAVDEDRVFISVASIAELRRGIALMDDGRRRAAATALAGNLTLVTRNVRDFTSFGVPLFNPWDE
jgi:hypothetical protein